MIKFEEFYEHSYVEEFHAKCSISKTTRKLSLCEKLETLSIMQHIKTKLQEFLVFKIQLLGKYGRQHHRKIPTKDGSVVWKEARISKETENEQESLYLIW